MSESKFGIPEKVKLEIERLAAEHLDGFSAGQEFSDWTMVADSSFKEGAEKGYQLAKDEAKGLIETLEYLSAYS